MRSFADHDATKRALDVTWDREEGTVTLFDPDDLRGEKWLQIDADALVEVTQP
ncbi:MAG: hypothetical protein RI560_03445 [Natronomonas sp.]|uniref:hypothetical protein n=1 Tax=Natronomonas sp. TaxID=2184060 RepID=UPI00286FEF09|nr:hypothetical protein [Natronomonas sp.]MDR9380713.1 hypothetical protein [Natronomonas sp.]MDR9431520.1 hypothetical protein [Natronomonas sp.]